MGARENERAASLVVAESEGVRNDVWVVAVKFHSAFDGRRGEDHQRVVYGQARECDDVDDREAAKDEGFLQFCSHRDLVVAGDGEDHSPVAALDVALPGAAAVLSQEIGLRGAELSQIGKAGNDDAVGGVRGANGASTCYETGESCVAASIKRLAVGKKCSVKKELPRGTGDDETVVRVNGRRIVFAGGGFACLRIELIFPDQVVGVGESICIEIEAAARGDRVCGAGVLFDCLHSVFNRTSLSKVGFACADRHLKNL